jgi:hypothetical protein
MWKRNRWSACQKPDWLKKPAHPATAWMIATTARKKSSAQSRSKWNDFVPRVPRKDIVFGQCSDQTASIRLNYPQTDWHESWFILHNALCKMIFEFALPCT